MGGLADRERVGCGRRADIIVTWWAKYVLVSQMAFGGLQSCSNVSSGHASCPGPPVCSTEAAVPSLSCPGLPAQPGTVGWCSRPHPRSSAVSSWSPPSPSVPASLCQPSQREQCPLHAQTQLAPPEFFHSVRNPFPDLAALPSHHFQVLHLPGPPSSSCRSRHLIAKPGQCAELGPIPENRLYKSRLKLLRVYSFSRENIVYY